MMGDDPLKCPCCSRYVDRSTDDLVHRDDCRWSGYDYDDFAAEVRENGFPGGGGHGS